MAVSQKVLLRERKNNGRELLIHLVNLREKTQSLSFLSDLGSLWIELSLLAPRSSLLGTSPGTSLATRSEERGARSEERGARSEERGETAVFAGYDLGGWFCTTDIH